MDVGIGFPNTVEPDMAAQNGVLRDLAYQPTAFEKLPVPRSIDEPGLKGPVEVVSRWVIQSDEDVIITFVVNARYPELPPGRGLVTTLVERRDTASPEGEVVDPGQNPVGRVNFRDSALSVDEDPLLGRRDGQGEAQEECRYPG